MRHKGLIKRGKRLNLTDAIIAFGKFRGAHPEHDALAQLGERLVREVQYMHKVLRAVRETLPKDYNGYFDPLRLDNALARTEVYDAGRQRHENTVLLCGRNGCENLAGGLHPCPYQSDINDDHEDYCSCCPDCTHECTMDI